MGEKLTESITVKVTPELLRVVRLRAEQRGFVSPGEYMRSLLDGDLEAARLTRETWETGKTLKTWGVGK